MSTTIFTIPTPSILISCRVAIGAIATKDIDEGLAAQLTSTLSNHLVNNLQFGWNHEYATFYLGKRP